MSRLIRLTGDSIGTVVSYVGSIESIGDQAVFNDTFGTHIWYKAYPSW